MLLCWTIYTIKHKFKAIRFILEVETHIEIIFSNGALSKVFKSTPSKIPRDLP
jgi:hypothetical protein